MASPVQDGCTRATDILTSVLCKSNVTLFFPMSVVLLFKHKQGSTIRWPVFFAFLSQVFVLSYQSLLSSFIHTIHLVSISVQSKEKKITAQQAEKHQSRGYDSRGSVVRLVFIVSWVFPSLLSAQEGFYSPEEILEGVQMIKQGDMGTNPMCWETSLTHWSHSSEWDY